VLALLSQQDPYAYELANRLAHEFVVSINAALQDAR